MRDTAALHRVDSGTSDIRDPRGYLNAVLETVAKRVVHIARSRTVEARETHPTGQPAQASTSAQSEELRSGEWVSLDSALARTGEGFDSAPQNPDRSSQVTDNAATPVCAFNLFGRVLEAFDGATTRDEVLDALLDGLGWAYERAAIFLLRGAVLEGWRSVCRGSSVDVGTLAFPLTLDSVLTRSIDSPALHIDHLERGLFGSGVSATLAAPIRMFGRPIGVAYCEIGERVPIEAVHLRAGFVCMLMDLASRHLGRVGASLSGPASLLDQRPQLTSSRPTYPGPARQTPRIRVSEGFQITVQGQPAQLIDVSSRGAQVVLEQRVQPNQRLTLLLPYDASQMVCKGQVVWARFEQPGHGEPRYRIGLEFVEVEASALEAFLASCGQSAQTEPDVRMVEGEPSMPRRRVG